MRKARSRSRQGAERIIKASPDLGLLWATDYGTHRMSQRGFDMNDARHLIRGGGLIAIEDERYRWQGPWLEDPDQTLEMVLEIGAGEEVEIITIFKIDPETRRGETILDEKPKVRKDE